MNIQFISDSAGRTTGVYIPIEEWNALKAKYIDIEKEAIDIPDWHQSVVSERMEAYRRNPDDVLDADATLNDIESQL